MATTISAGTLRLLLTSIGYRAKARKEMRRQAANGSAPPAAPLPLDCPPGGGCALTADRCQIASRRAGMVCAMLYCLAWIYNRDAPEHPYIHYYNRRLCCPVQRPAWRWYLVSVETQRLTVCPPARSRRCIAGLCGCCIVCAGMGQINGNAPVKPCKQF